MTSAQNKAIVARFFRAFEGNDQAALNELLAPELMAYSHGAPGPQNRETHVRGVAIWNSAFSNTTFTIEEQIAEGDTVATRVTMQSTHSRGDFMGLPPTGKQVTVPAVTIEKVKDGKIVERRVYSDMLKMMQQLGVVPPPQPAG
jgi:steroid delta-isomerase-like uncharacterized protein